MIGMEIACFPIVLWVLGEMLAGAASIVGSYQKAFIMIGIEIACFPIVLYLLTYLMGPCILK